MAGLAILLIFNFLGLLLHRYAHVPLPENVLGMLLLLLALGTGAVKLAWVEEAADFLLRHMMLFFAPVIVGVLPLWDVIQANIGPVAGGMVLSTFVTMAATAWAAQGLMRKGAAHGG
jgi:holin-like protein